MAQLKKAIGALFCFLCLVVPLTSGESVEFEDCSGTTTVANVNRVDVFDLPVLIGQKVTFIISASADKEIAGGSLQIFTSEAGFDIPVGILDLCRTTRCPITAGAFTITHTQLLLQILPGENEVRIKAYDTDRSPLICISFAIDVVLRLESLLPSGSIFLQQEGLVAV